MASKYHTKRFTHTTSFTHTRRQEVKMMKAAERGGVNKSEIIRRLIDTL